MLTRDVLAAWASLGVLLAAALILLATLTPPGAGGLGASAGGGGPHCPFGLHCAIWHMLLFALLGVPVALRYAASRAAARAPLRVLLMVVLALWVFAALDELAQGWVPGRQPSLADWFADMGGALIGMALGSAAFRLLIARYARGAGSA